MNKPVFNIEETTVDAIHKAMSKDKISSEDLVSMYISRIEKYDEKLNSIVLVNPNAIEEARILDKKWNETKQKAGPLHGIPVLIKDQYFTKGMPTSFGSIAFKEFEAKEDATIIKRLKRAGAIILGKTALPDFATSWFGFSSGIGKTKNPYDLTRDPGASSSGTGASIAANLGAIGIGSDCGGSIRVPASFCNLFSVRVTTGMISRHGMSPLVSFQDTPGPMTRTVKDAAILLDTLVGFDSEDILTGVANYKKDSYVNALNKNSLKTARIGVLREVFGTGEDSKLVNEVTNEAIKKMESVGTEIVEVSIPDLENYLAETSLYTTQSKKDINEFITEIKKMDNNNVQVESINEIYDNKQYHEELDLFEAIVEEAPEKPEESSDYFKKRLSQHELRQEILYLLAEYNLDGIVFPDVQVLPPVQDDIPNLDYTVLTFPTNTIIASQSGVPAISMPAGFTEEGIPVGIELIGKPYDEGALLSLAYSYEQITKTRKSPTEFSD